MNDILTLDFVINVAGQEVLGTLGAIAVAFLIQILYKRLKFNGWTVEIWNRDGEHVLSRPLGMQKAEQVFDDMSDMSVYLKGLCSTFGWLAVDLVTKGVDMGATVIDTSKKEIRINLSIEGVLSKPRPRPQTLTREDLIQVLQEAGLLK